MTFSFARFRYLSIQLAIVFLLSIGAMPTAYANEVGREQLPSISAQTSITETGATTETKESGVKLPGLGREPAAPADEAAPTPTPMPTEEPAALGPIDNLEDAQSAVIQIEAVGTFEDPEEGLIPNAAGRGSGFIIDPSGIAVTNNHVVTGAAFLKVFVAGEDEPRNARVLGVSECSDLAVIDIQGDGFPYLTWYKGTIKVGLDVYAAGFPLGDPEYTLTRGIVSKAQANGDTSWASVDSVLQHDATINRGNSGGPLIDADGAVVAVNYAGNASTNQYFAISSVDAIPIVENLMTGSDVNALGINGQAVSDGEQLSGIWVASVKSGSPADQIGIKSGDIIVTMEGVQLATDGTMADYCNILRSHDAEDVLTVQVLRFDTKEMLKGQINGRVLEQSFSFADTLEEDNSGSQ
ncbi:MAG: serine protease, partial [Caldilineaceae bacterium]|nr:serine protease [Caldilineaceae bacterium]